jgi:hypothetical protein
MTNNQNPAPRFASHAERLAYFSASKATTAMPTTPIRHPAPKPRRNSVPHRAIR